MPLSDSAVSSSKRDVENAKVARETARLMALPTKGSRNAMLFFDGNHLAKMKRKAFFPPTPQ